MNMIGGGPPSSESPGQSGDVVPPAGINIKVASERMDGLIDEARNKIPPPSLDEQFEKLFEGVDSDSPTDAALKFQRLADTLRKGIGEPLTEAHAREMINGCLEMYVISRRRMASSQAGAVPWTDDDLVSFVKTLEESVGLDEEAAKLIINRHGPRR
jgi:hypothetical protein